MDSSAKNEQVQNRRQSNGIRSSLRTEPYSSHHRRRLISQTIQQLNVFFQASENHVNEVNAIDLVSNTVVENPLLSDTPAEDDFQSCFSDFDDEECYDTDASPLPTASEYETSDDDSRLLDRLAEFDNESDSDIDGDRNDSVTFKQAIALWAVTRRICQNAVDELLSIFRKYPWGQTMPKSCRSLVKSMRKIPLKTCAGGHYFHFGIFAQLVKILPLINDDRVPEEIQLVISTDGVPLSKSSKSQFWPLTGLIGNIDFRKVFIIGLWHGQSKPSNANEFLKEFIFEAKQLSADSFSYRGKRIRFKIVLYVCDAPARSFVKFIKSHSGFFGCPYCIQEGEYHGWTLFLKNVSVLRTDFSFRQRVHEEHHVGNSDLETLNCDMILDFPNCPQHLIDLGVTRKLMRKWFSGPRPNKLRPAEILKLSTRMVELEKFIPFEFARKPRSIDFFPQFKSTEFALFNSPVVLQNILPEREFKNFLVFHVAVKLMSSKKYCYSLNDYIKTLLLFFVVDCLAIYGDEFISYNVQNLLHLGEQILRFGPLYKFSAYLFESYYQIFKKVLRKGNQVLQQVVNRIFELNVTLLQGIQYPPKLLCTFSFFVPFYMASYGTTSPPFFLTLRVRRKR
ncbi:uncharacterized protein LOC116918704 [Daphnia magna]|uniref:uncharacterized protein LOC116918704 n=1 Tax=Daphnia magna TaxID=35525 RepID=UPI0014036757|nr:uncharacterized protein LOC116918704 [Daphnia magna]